MAEEKEKGMFSLRDNAGNVCAIPKVEGCELVGLARRG